MSNFPYTSGEDFSEEDLDTIHELVNDQSLNTYITGLETGGYLTELAWLEQVTADLETQYRVCCAVAVASATGRLKNLSLTLPKEEGQEDA